MLQGKNAVITGAGGGFGEGIARHFASLGANVIVADIKDAEARRVADAINKEAGRERAFAVSVDVSKDESVSELYRQAVAAFGRLDIVINNAGIAQKNQPLTDTTEEVFDRIFAVNVKSIFLSARHALPIFRGQGDGGCFVNICSTAAIRPRPGLAWYNGSKGAAVTITKTMAVELAPEKIRVNAINPVMSDTGMISDFLPGDGGQFGIDKVIASIPLGRLSKPIDIAKAAAFLASEQAEFITGVCLEVDGGRCV